MPPRHVYVHVPFCARRCSYCDFSIAVRRETPVDEFLDALRREVAMRGERGRAETIYLGGGTPSRLGGPGVRHALDIVREFHDPVANAEVTIEANPDDVTADAAAAWRAAGVNRISIGAQSFDDAVLRWMHRTHDARAIGTAVRAARDAGFDNVSLDLIFALPREVRRDWTADLASALALEPDHISLYGLTIEPATPLARWRDRGAVRDIPDDDYEREYLLAHETLVSRGFDHYEVSNFARPAKRSRHNSAYWSGVSYEAYGPSAHRFDGATRAWNVREYAEWVRRLCAGTDPTGGRETLTSDEVGLERAYLELRTVRGVETNGFDVAAWIDAGWAERAGSRTRLTPAGWLRLDALATSLTGGGSPCNV